MPCNFGKEVYAEIFFDGDYIKEIYEKPMHGSLVDDYHLQEKLLYNLGKLCIPNNKMIHVIKEAHASLV